jgi:hypothetical protein
MTASLDPSRCLPAELTIFTAAQTRTEWLAWLDPLNGDDGAGNEVSGPWRVLADGVDQVDAAGVQLLISLAHALQARDRPLQLSDASARLRQACEALGVAEWLQVVSQPVEADGAADVIDTAASTERGLAR